MMPSMSETSTLVELPPGRYAIVDLFGHTRLVGRIEEVEMYGTKMMAIEVLFRDVLLPPVFYGGAAIYGLTPCSDEVASAHQPRFDYQIPAAIRCIVPPLLLKAADDQEIAGETVDDDNTLGWP